MPQVHGPHPEPGLAEPDRRGIGDAVVAPTTTDHGWVGAVCRASHLRPIGATSTVTQPGQGGRERRPTRVPPGQVSPPGRPSRPPAPRRSPCSVRRSRRPDPPSHPGRSPEPGIGRRARRTSLLGGVTAAAMAPSRSRRSEEGEGRSSKPRPGWVARAARDGEAPRHGGPGRDRPASAASPSGPGTTSSMGDPVVDGTRVPSGRWRSARVAQRSARVRSTRRPGSPHRHGSPRRRCPGRVVGARMRGRLRSRDRASCIALMLTSAASTMIRPTVLG